MELQIGIKNQELYQDHDEGVITHMNHMTHLHYITHMTHVTHLHYIRHTLYVTHMTHAHYEPYDPRGTKTPIHTGNTVDKHGGKIREHREKYASTGGNTGARGENTGARGKYQIPSSGKRNIHDSHRGTLRHRLCARIWKVEFC